MRYARGSFRPCSLLPNSWNWGILTRILGNRWHRKDFPGLWRWKRKQVLEFTPYCVECYSGCEFFRESPLECHHVDGDPKNERWDNLAILCDFCNTPNHVPYLTCPSPSCGNILIWFEGAWICESAIVPKCWLSSDCVLEQGHGGPHEI